MSKLNLKDGICKSTLFDIIIVVIKFFILFKSYIKKEQLIFLFISLVEYFIILRLLPIISLIDKSFELIDVLNSPLIIILSIEKKTKIIKF